MAIPHRITSSAFASPTSRNRRATTRAAPSHPLRDWRRAFALVDRLTAEFRGEAWFRGVRAFWDAHRDEIRLEVEVFWEAAQAVVPADLVGRAIHFRCVAPANAR